MYKLKIEQRAERDLKRLKKSLSKENFDRIISSILALEEEPRPQGVHKIVESENDWRVRIGNHRIIYEINDKKEGGYNISDKT